MVNALGSCRLKYELISSSNKKISIDNGYLLSTRDLCGLNYLPDLIRIGIASLKIEGRMKTPEYVATVTRIYRKYIDLVYENKEFVIDEQDQKDLLQVFNRGGFSSGHYEQEANRNLVFKEKPSNMGIYIGNVANYNETKGHITLNLNDNLKVGDTITFEKEDTKYKISELMIAKKNIDFAINGQLVTIGRMKGNIHPSDKIYKLESKSLTNKTKATYADENKKHLLFCDMKVQKDKPIAIHIYDNDYINFKITSNIVPEFAVKQPITKERIISQFSKTGNTPFAFDKFNIALQDNLYINIRDLNELRRNCLEKVAQIVTSQYKRNLPNKLIDNISFSYKERMVNKKQISVLLNILDIATNYSDLENVDRIYIPLHYFAIPDYSNIINTISKQFATYIYMPTIIKSNYKNLYTTHIEKALEKYPLKGFVVSNLSTINMLDKYKNDYELIGNYTLNVYNTYSLKAYDEFGFLNLTLSPELNKNDIVELCKTSKQKLELIVYGKTPVMTTAYCFLGSSNKCYPNCKSLCTKSNTYYLKDRLGLYFRILIDNVQTITTIYNSKTTSLDFSDLFIDCVRIDFLDENILEMNNVIKTVKSEKRLEGKDYTNANFIRDV